MRSFLRFILAFVLLLAAVLVSRRGIETPSARDVGTQTPRTGPAGAWQMDDRPDVPADVPESPHPVERAVAEGVVLSSRWARNPAAGTWIRSRLVQTKVQPRPVRVVETWKQGPDPQGVFCVGREMFLADQVIVNVAGGVDRERLDGGLKAGGMRIQRWISEGVFRVRLARADLDAVPDALEFLRGIPRLVRSAEPDGVGFGAGTPNDPSFSSQWGCHNTGQSGGTIDADVDAPEFWDIIEEAPGVVIAVLDSGLNFSHPDLQGISWTNPGETDCDGIDNDGSGKVDDIRGWDFVNNDNNPTDDHGHGSNVTGIIAANRNNGIGIAGMIGGVRILSCKILNSSNSGTTSNLIAATTYARQRGVPVMNLSLQNYPYSSTLDSEFNACRSAGIVLSICAGNQGANNDASANYPSCYPHDNIIAVGNHDRTDVRWSGSFNPSNYGATRVDLFAPGRSILSPVLGSSYSSYTGTSQAAPFVTAVCAAILHVNPSWGAEEIKDCILSSVVARPAYSGICVTGGRLNAVDSIACALRQQPAADSDDDGFPNLLEYLAGTRIDSVSSKPAVFHQIDGGFLQLGMPRVSRPDAHLEVETSLDLRTWTTIGVSDFSTPETLMGGIPMSGGPPRGFLRIKALPTPGP